jgi:hypothetical protein
MLDLKALERKIDEMIASDSPEEMKEWVLKKKLGQFAEFLPIDELEPMGGDSGCIFVNTVVVTKNSNKEPFVAVTSRLAAAA